MSEVLKRIGAAVAVIRLLGVDLHPSADPDVLRRVRRMSLRRFAGRLDADDMAQCVVSMFALRYRDIAEKPSLAAFVERADDSRAAEIGAVFRACVERVLRGVAFDAPYRVGRDNRSGMMFSTFLDKSSAQPRFVRRMFDPAAVDCFPGAAPRWVREHLDQIDGGPHAGAFRIGLDCLGLADRCPEHSRVRDRAERGAVLWDGVHYIQDRGAFVYASYGERETD